MQLITEYKGIKIYKSSDNKFCAKFQFKNYVHSQIDILIGELKDALLTHYEDQLQSINESFNLNLPINDIGSGNQISIEIRNQFIQKLDLITV